MSLPQNSNSPLSDLAQNNSEPVFQAPWEARVFAMVHQLANAQKYSWSEWTEHFAEEISLAEQASTDMSSYYERWVRTCEKLLITKGILHPLAIDQRMEELLREHETAGTHGHNDRPA
ncbi:nitrile hydratase accessory protein [Leptothoe sp. PORK10 BA2]|uniref:nitrile hydratase accessory protein n=1 Tax=Leptothoe sp. PORK10 BA2 TaxID=3110254 RepID=UPI002B21717C|nr:nitrile hydratase accessory protein [Leptothoe sp. PORK10 BA2]MEA5464683.1 nitrile hydratase accessory protein [Leptothoe sp. PORK10 BA2]